jgi:hypothetical protein
MEQRDGLPAGISFAGSSAGMVKPANQLFNYNAACPSKVGTILANDSLCFNWLAVWPCRLLLRGKEKIIMKRNIRVSLAFVSFNSDQFNSFVMLVLVCLKTNPLFPNLPVSLAVLGTMLTAYQNAMTAAAMGGPKDTAVLGETRDTLNGAMRQTAGYIQSLGLTNESDLLSSGFDIIVPGKHPSQPLTQPVFSLDNSVSGKLGVFLEAVPHAKAYHVQFCTGTAPWVDLGIFPNTKNIIVPNLTPGTVYSVRVQAIGGSTQYSVWSGVNSLMST